MGAALAAVLALAPGSRGDRALVFVFSLLFIEWVAATTLAVIYLVRNWAAQLDPPRLATFAVVVLLCNTSLIGTVAWAIALGLTPDVESWPEMIARVTLIALCMSLPALAAFRNYWRMHQLAAETQRAQLASIHARIRPHFLFNTLNTGAALVRSHPETAELLLLDLSDLFRAALAGPHDITLEEELALVDRYLKIEALRFGPRLRTTWNIDPSAMNAKVPALSVQTIVENAIRHGIERVSAGGEVRISVQRMRTAVEIEIVNPIPRGDSEVARAGHQVGLSAARASVAATTGGRGQVYAEIEGETFVCRLTFPTAA